MIWKFRKDRRRKSNPGTNSVKRRPRGPERLEARRLLAADPIRIGLVYLETDYLETDQDLGGDSQGDRFILSFTGGAPNTELTEVRIRTDKDGDGISVGDPIYDTAEGYRGKDRWQPFRVVKTLDVAGGQISVSAEVDDGGQELVLRLTNFNAGDRLEFTIDVDEVLRNAIDLEIFNDRLDVITSGQEFQDSILEATFNAPNYETSYADAIFLNDYGDPSSTYGLNLPPDDGDDIDSRPNRSAAAVATTLQIALPIDISGQVWVDNDLDSQREPGETLLSGVEIALWKQESGDKYVDTGLRAITDNDGKYAFSKSLGLRPGNYRLVESQPDDLFSVAAVPGTVNGVETGRAESIDILADVAIPLGGSSAVNYDFAEAEPASLSGFVYQDNDNDGEREGGEPGIAGVRVRLVPISTIATQATLTVTTSGDGSYSFTGLAPGSYEVIEVDQPSDLNDGLDRAGTVAGRTVGSALNPGDRINGVDLAGGDSGIEYNFGEVPFGSISGFVYLAAPGRDCSGIQDGNGTTPLSGVEIILQTDLGVTIASTITGFDGSYAFDSVPVGNYRIIEVTPEGLIDGSSDVGQIDDVTVGTSIDGGLIQEIVMTAGGEGVEYNFCEIAPASISGYVYLDQSNDGRRDQNEDPIEGTRISLVDTTGVVVASTTTNAQGRYQFDGLRPGDYSLIEAQPTGFLDGIDSVGTVGGKTVGVIDGNDRIVLINLQQGDDGVEYNFGELLPASLRGRVHVSVDGDCTFNDDDQNLAGVTIRLIDADGNEVASKVTDANGQYAFDNLVPGNYTIIEEQPVGFFEGDAEPGSAGGNVIDGSQIGNITLSSGLTAVNYNFCERPPSEISGSVANDRNGNRRFDADETGIDGVRIELYQAGNLVATTSTDSSGNYRFTNLPSGNYTVREIQPIGWLQAGQRAGSAGGDDSRIDLISQIPIGWGESLIQYNFYEVQPSSISGFVHRGDDGDCDIDPNDLPIEGVKIELRDSSGRVVATTNTDANGQYRFDGLASGLYQIFEYQPDGMFQGGQRVGTGDGQVLGTDLLGVTLSPGQNVENYNFCEVPPSSIGGMVWQESDPNGKFDPGDVPIPGVLIDLISDSGDVIRQLRTDSQGKYRFTALAPGIYSVREYQPIGLFQGGQIVGDLGGEVGGDDLLVGITLNGGVDGNDYNFPEVPPAILSGFVFQDGDLIRTTDQIDPTELRDFRDGLLTADDTRLGDVTLELRNILGLPFDASRAIPGTYADGPITTTTDQLGYYEFTGLRPGTYFVYQIQPQNYIDGLDTPGTTGGVAVNQADEVDDGERILIQTLSLGELTSPNDDAILNITLVAGGRSDNNNFSEILVDDILAPAPETPTREIPRVETPIETFETQIRLVTFAEPRTLRNSVIAIDQWAVSWHLSVINGGFPRGTVGEDGIIRTVGARQMNQEWTEGSRSIGRWSIARSDGSKMRLGNEIRIGGKNATALAGDFDGDGIDEAVIYAGGQWFVDLNGNGCWDAGDLWMLLGTELDRPIIGDWDGDGKDDIGIFGRQWLRDPYRIKHDPGLPDPDNKRRREVDLRKAVAKDDEGRGEDRQRLLKRGNDGSLRSDAVDHVFQYGEQADSPITGDWNGDGIDQIGIFRNGKWLLDVNGDGRWTDVDIEAEFGRPGDLPVVGDFNGDGVDEIAVVRGDQWIIDTDGDRRITGNDQIIDVPRDGDDSQPVVGDWDGDGKDEPGYYDEAA